MERKAKEKGQVLEKDTNKRALRKGMANTNQKDMGKEKGIKVMGKEEREKTDLEWELMEGRSSMGTATIATKRDTQKQDAPNWDWDSEEIARDVGKLDTQKHNVQFHT